MTADHLQSLSRGFRDQATAFHESSPLYEHLALHIAEDDELLDLANVGPASQRVLLFFGAVHYLLLHDHGQPLAAFFPTLTAEPQPIAASFPVFRAFCLENSAAVRQTMLSHRVQTNEVQRCAALFPAFGQVIPASSGAVAFIEIGTSAGLNLLWDRYGYWYDQRPAGDTASRLQLHCTQKGALAVPIPEKLPAIASRVGIDLHPLDITDSETGIWLQALIWPEQTERVRVLREAIALAQLDTPPIITGNALDVLPQVVATIPEAQGICIYHAHVLYQLSGEERGEMETLIQYLAQSHSIYHVALEWERQYSTLRITDYAQDVPQAIELAHCSPHGQWIEWLAQRPV